MPDKYTRRDFLKTSATATGVLITAPYILTTGVQASPQVPYSPKPPLGRVVQSDRGSAWDYVRSMLDKVTPHLVSYELIVGDYRLRRAVHGVFVLDNSEHKLVDWKTGSFSVECFHPNDPTEERLSASKIFSRSEIRKGEGSIKYTWRKAGNVGGLVQLQANLHDCSPEHNYVNYEKSLGFQRNDPWIPPEYPIASKTPESLVGQTEILGVPIPWTIDFDKKAWEIVDKFGIERLVKVLEARL